MAVRSKSRCRSDAILVNHAQAPEAHELRVIIIGKRKRVVRIEPAMIGVAPLITSANLYHFEISFCWPVSTRAPAPNRPNFLSREKTRRFSLAVKTAIADSSSAAWLPDLVST